MIGRHLGKREQGEEPESGHKTQPGFVLYEGDRLARDGTTEPVSRDQIFRRALEQEKIKSCSADHEQD